MTVSPDDAGVRLDRYLADRLSDLSRNQVQSLVLEGAVFVNGAAAKAARKLQPGDVLTVDLPSGAVGDRSLVASPEIELRVLHSDDAIIVLDKPAGQVVHPAAGHSADTLVNALLARFPDLAFAFEDERPGIVHRLDRDTSGVLVVARTEAAAADLRSQFKSRTVEKAYLLLTKGIVTPPAGVIEAPIGRDPLQRKRMAAVPDGRPAQTVYRVLDQSGDYSWIEARPRTGRTHQIRVHFAAIGHPVTGDTVYGKRDRRIGRMALHAWQLGFDHPGTGERAEFSAPLPDDMLSALSELGIVWRPEG
jgi:23S rRNA pseudouridine1911/1915/1917 synthase